MDTVLSIPFSSPDRVSSDISFLIFIFVYCFINSDEQASNSAKRIVLVFNLTLVEIL